MNRTRVVCVAVCAAALLSLQPFPAIGQTPASAEIRHFRLTLAVTYAQGQRPPQSFVLDVPVASDRSGMASSSSVAGLTGETGEGTEETLQLTDVHVSAKGLAVRVSFTSNSVGQPRAGETEPVHSNLTFKQSIDVALGTPTRIDGPMRARPLAAGNASATNDDSATPQFTMTAVAM